LWRAAKKGDVGAIRGLVAAGADPNAKKHSLNVEGDTPLHFAAEFGKIAAIRELVKLGARPNAKDDGGGTPLIRAVFERHRETVLDTLIECGADVNIQERSGETALCMAASWGDIRLCRYLLSAGADPNVRRREKQACPLAHAAWSNNLALVKLLLEAGASLSQPKPGGLLPITSAVLRRNMGMLDLLLKAGADANQREVDERIPLMVAAVRRGEAEIIRRLLEAGANPNFEEDATGKTAMDVAEEMKRQELVDVIKKHGGKNGSRRTRWQDVAEEARRDYLKAEELKRKNRVE